IPHHVWMHDFQKNGYDRRGADLKQIKNVLLGLLGSTCSWEVVVGQAIATEPLTADPHSLGDYLGSKVLQHILKKIDVVSFDPTTARARSIPKRAGRNSEAYFDESALTVT